MKSTGDDRVAMSLDLIKGGVRLQSHYAGRRRRHISAASSTQGSPRMPAFSVEGGLILHVITVTSLVAWVRKLHP